MKRRIIFMMIVAIAALCLPEVAKARKSLAQSRKSIGMEQSGLLCYKRCKRGYTGVGPVCWQNCPRGFKNHGLFCFKPKPYGRGFGFGLIPFAEWNLNNAKKRCEKKHGRGKCEQHGLIIYPKCKRGYHAFGCCICSPNCVDGMKDIGVSCAKKSYGRGLGKPIPSIIKGIGKVFKKVGSGIRNVVKKVGSGIRNVVKKVGAGLKKVGAGIKNVVQKVFTGTLAGLVKLFNLVKTVVQCSGIGDIVKWTTALIGDPKKFFTKDIPNFFKPIWTVLKSLVTELPGFIMSLSSMKTSQALDKVMDWIWVQMNRLARISTPISCLVKFIAPIRGKIAGAVKGIITTVLGFVPKIVGWLEPQLAPLLSKLLEKIVDKVAGKEWKEKIKTYAAKLFDPVKKMKEAAKRMGQFLASVKKGAPDIMKSWMSARAFITQAPDLGVRQIFYVAKAAINDLFTLLMDKVKPELVKVGKKVADVAPTMFNGVVDALCGLIPEAGAAVCTFLITRVVRFGWSFIGNTLLGKGLHLAISKIGALLIKKILIWLENTLVKQAGRFNKSKVGWIGRLFSRFVKVIYDTIQKWALPNANLVYQYQQKVAAFGDLIVKLATKKTVRAPSIKKLTLPKL